MKTVRYHQHPGEIARALRDIQLETAVDVVLKGIARHPVVVPPPLAWIPTFPRQLNYLPWPMSSGICQ